MDFSVLVFTIFKISLLILLYKIQSDLFVKICISISSHSSFSKGDHFEGICKYDVIGCVTGKCSSQVFDYFTGEFKAFKIVSGEI